MGSVAAAGLAGCLRHSPNQSFEATPVVLPEADRDALALGETKRDDYTIERSGPSGNVTVTVTSQIAVYSRHAGLGGE
ncbi:MAG: hypothetical protein U5K37_00560 [Natrialbaceae archaeon]|nr:hypothetical protein [Natrialbaceae archaeon]